MKKLLTFLMMSILAIGVGWADTTYTMTIDGNASGNNNVHWIDDNTTTLSYNSVTWNTSITWQDNSKKNHGNAKNYKTIGTTNNPISTVTISTSAFAGKKLYLPHCQDFQTHLVILLI